MREKWENLIHHQDEARLSSRNFHRIPCRFPRSSRDFSRTRTYNRNIEPPAARLTEWVIDVVDSHRAEKESTRSSGHMSELSRISSEVLRSWFPFNYWATLSALLVLQTFCFFFFLFYFGKLSRSSTYYKTKSPLRARKKFPVEWKTLFVKLYGVCA